jgi:hypothetical protein
MERKRRVLVQEKRKLLNSRNRAEREASARETLNSLSNTFRDLLFRMFYVLVDIFRFSVVSFLSVKRVYRV